MKHIALILLILCLLPCTALAANGDLPDIGAFANGLVEIDPEETDVLDYAIEKLYRGSDSDVLSVATEYIALITEEYDMKEICHFPTSDGDTTRVRYAFEYTNSYPEINMMTRTNDKAGWKICSYQVMIEYSQSDYYDQEYIMIDYRSEFNYTDTGDRISESAISTVAAEECPVCEGTGDCPKCGGDMWVWGYEWEYVNGSPVSVNKNRLCDGIYCYGGSCDKCGGDGVL